nr:hypothetical protein CFP56_01078 [Quercus suber]
MICLSIHSSSSCPPSYLCRVHAQGCLDEHENSRAHGHLFQSRRGEIPSWFHEEYLKIIWVRLLDLSRADNVHISMNCGTWLTAPLAPAYTAVMLKEHLGLHIIHIWDFGLSDPPIPPSALHPEPHRVTPRIGASTHDRSRSLLLPFSGLRVPARRSPQPAPDRRHTTHEQCRRWCRQRRRQQWPKQRPLRIPDPCRDHDLPCAHRILHLRKPAMGGAGRLEFCPRHRVGHEYSVVLLGDVDGHTATFTLDRRCVQDDHQRINTGRVEMTYADSHLDHFADVPDMYVNQAQDNSIALPRALPTTKTPYLKRPILRKTCRSSTANMT